MAFEAGVRPWLMCRAGSHTCALPLAGIRETMRPLPTEPFPNAPSFIAGLAVIRGDATPVVNLAVLLGETGHTIGRFVTALINERPIALGVESVLGIHTFETVVTGDLPPLLKDVAADMVSAVAARDAQLLLFLEMARILPADVLNLIAPTAAAS